MAEQMQLQLFRINTDGVWETIPKKYKEEFYDKIAQITKNIIVEKLVQPCVKGEDKNEAIELQK